MRRYHFDNPDVEHPALRSFADLVSEFCEYVDRVVEGGIESPAPALQVLLAKLYLGALELPSTEVLYDLDLDDDEEVEDDGEVEPVRPDPDRLDAEEFRVLCSALGERFTSFNYYREIFDPYEPPEREEVMGSLADDIADIYQDLRGGMNKWRRGSSGEALWEWRFNFEVHWGEHATGALRALHTRAAWWDNPWPAG